MCHPNSTEPAIPVNFAAGPPCRKCGYDSDIPRHFCLGEEGSLCLACAEHEPVRYHQAWFAFALLLVVCGLGLLATVGAGWGLVNLGLLILLPMLLVPLHELGHVLAARASWAWRFRRLLSDVGHSWLRADFWEPPGHGTGT